MAIDPTLRFRLGGPGQRSRGPLAVDGTLRQLAGWIEQRRRSRDSPQTGVALLLSYELFRSHPQLDDPAANLPVLLALDVDRSVRVRDDGPLEFSAGCDEALQHEIEAALDDPPAPLADRTVPSGPPVSSLPREAYLRAVAAVQQRIRRGDIYQANLCQRFQVPFEGDGHQLYRRMIASTAAPHSAFVETPEFTLASISPESFLRGSGRDVETWPIKGTRPRHRDAGRDRQAAEELLSSPKDRAELLMIVDLERNDLGRVAVPGSVTVDELAGLRSFSTVHHLVACVRARLADDCGLDDLIRATFPGGSITGAPKRSAMEILTGLEPVPRGWFTGSLFWFGDDGTTDSSILIRSLILHEGQALVGAGGGVVADSDPAAEWEESNHKARGLTAALGFDPQEAAARMRE